MPKIAFPALALLAAFSMLATGCETFEDARPAGPDKPTAVAPKAGADKRPEWPVLVPREKWKCDDLELRAYEYTGTVIVAGTSTDTLFKIDGIERRWDWCLEDGSFECSVVISPDGWGRYYNFRGTEGRTKASDVFKCRKL